MGLCWLLRGTGIRSGTRKQHGKSTGSSTSRSSTSSSVSFNNEEVLGNYFPCDIMLPDSTYIRLGRLLVTKNHVHVYRDEQAIDPLTGRIVGKVPAVVLVSEHIALAALPDTQLPKRRQRVFANTKAGTVVAQVLFGCGCGSSLRFLGIEESLALSTSHLAALQ